MTKAIKQAIRAVSSEFSQSSAAHDFKLATSREYRARWESISDIERKAFEKVLELDREALKEREATDKSRELETRSRLRRRDVESTGIPGKDIDAIMGGELKETKAMSIAREFLAAPNQTMLILSGPRGCGKTVAAGYILTASTFPWLEAEDDEAENSGTISDANFAHWPRSDKNPSFIDVSRLARISRYDNDVMNRIEQVPCLVIDDLGMEFSDKGGSFLATLDGIVNARYAAQRITIITTNLPASEFKKRYGERISDRVRESGRFVELNGKSMRGK